MTYDCRSQGHSKTCVHGPHGHGEAARAHTDKTEEDVLKLKRDHYESGLSSAAAQGDAAIWLGVCVCVWPEKCSHGVQTGSRHSDTTQAPRQADGDAAS